MPSTVGGEIQRPPDDGRLRLRRIYAVLCDPGCSCAWTSEVCPESRMVRQTDAGATDGADTVMKPACIIIIIIIVGVFGSISRSAQIFTQPRNTTINPLHRHQSILGQYKCRWKYSIVDADAGTRDGLRSSSPSRGDSRSLFESDEGANIQLSRYPIVARFPSCSS